MSALTTAPALSPEPTLREGPRPVATPRRAGTPGPRPAPRPRPAVAPRTAVLPAAQRGPRLAPFVLLVLTLLASGLVAMLLLNTVLAQGAFTQASLVKTSAKLADEQQLMTERLAREASSEVLAKRAATLGLVPSCGTLFLRVKTATTLGQPCAKTSGAPAAAAKPATASSKPSASKPSASKPSATKSSATKGSGKRP